MMRGKFFFLLCLFAAHALGGIAQENYVWNTVKIGGGGFVSGIVTHPKAKDVAYMRTDVGGAYRWNADEERWEGMIDWINKDQVGLLGVESIAIDPSNPDMVYLLCGTTYWNNGLTMILRSDDRGRSWKKTDVTSKFKAHGNGGGRGCDERLAVDPHDAKHLVCGTRWNGLWKSTNSGITWTRISKFSTPTGTYNDNGVTCVFFDPDTDSTYYVAVSRAADNLYVTRDGGKSFAMVEGVPAGLCMQHVAVVGRTAYMTFATNSCPNVNDSNQGAIMTLNLDDMTWTDITPSGYVHSFSGISVDPQNPKRIVATTACLWQTGQNWISGATTWGDEVLRTTNGGKTWTQLFGSGKMKFSAGEFAWMKSSSQLHWAGDIELDPSNPNRAWIISGNGIYGTTDLWNSAMVKWDFCVSGLEETVPLDFVSGATGAQLISVIGDYDGFRHETPYSASAYGRHSPSIGTSEGIAIAALNCDICARAGGRGGLKGFYSTDNGRTWKTLKTAPGTTGDAHSGSMALSADGQTLVWAAKGTGVDAVFVTHDMGDSWTECAGLPGKTRPVADAVNPQRFYAVTNGTLYRSTDGGDTWQTATQPGKLNGRLRAVPGHEGHLLMSASGTIKRSTDGGDTWKTISGVSNVECVAVGKEAPGADYPTLFAYGMRGAFTGIYRSTDLGATWLCTNDADHQFGGLGNAGIIEADQQVFGRVYMSTAGRGIAFGEPSTQTAGRSMNGAAEPLFMDMVHHNPGEPLYESIYNDPKVLKEMGYNAKCFFLFDSPTLAINWDGYDKEIMPEGSPERKWVELKAARLHKLYNECKAAGIDVYAMSDLVLMPKRLVGKYHLEETFGKPLEPKTQELQRYQIQQTFKQFPQMDGLVVRIGETYLHDAPYHIGSIRDKGDADKCIIPLINLLRDEICVKLGKKLVFRTWWTFDTDTDKYDYVSSHIEPHPNLIFSIKHCEGDFHRGSPYSKVQATGRHRQIIEVQCAREYEGKGAFPNYIARGVIDGFEEDAMRRMRGQTACLRDVYQSGLLAGVWTWTRGGGWEGPYIKDELWCDLNAWVMTQWASNPEKTEEEIFNAYATERLGLDAGNAAVLRRIALLSEHATLRGIRSAAYPDDVFNMWTRDEYITFPDVPSDLSHLATILAERDEAVSDWEEIVALSEQFRSDNAYLNEVVRVTCQYGLHMYRIFRSVYHLAGIHHRNIAEDKTRYIAEYEQAWSDLQQLQTDFPTTCPALYARDKVLRTSPTTADSMVKAMSKELSQTENKNKKQ